MPFVAPIRPRNLVWIAVLGGLWFGAARYGSPHVLTTYRWSGTTARPFYYDCQYWGRHPFRLAPQNGVCPLVVLARSNRER